MKVNQLRSVLDRFGRLHADLGHDDKAAALHGLAKVLKKHDKKTVSSLVKHHKKLQQKNRVTK